MTESLYFRLTKDQSPPSSTSAGLGRPGTLDSLAGCSPQQACACVKRTHIPPRLARGDWNRVPALRSTTVPIHTHTHTN
ncbi:hypothetical protein XELAEV_18022410mg [Xenopus laevis]|uniref:Uncharacterized protein n=1 Tax=Xenopus laevis TaxID=8355 RepID=A0A974HND6_XENLA|nr:hypothetical protein XELAEV_18022410mg [Xenopus laevis]